MKKIIISVSFLLTILLPVLFVGMSTSLAQPEVVKIGNPLSETYDNPNAGDIENFFSKRFGNLLDVMFGLLGAIAIFPVVIGGIQLIISRGNTDMATKGKKTLTWGVLGLLIAFSGIIFFNFLLGALIQK